MQTVKEKRVIRTEASVTGATPRQGRFGLRARLLGWAMLLAGCASTPPAPSPAAPSPAEARALIAQLLPSGTPDRDGWAGDIYVAFAVMDIAPSRENACAVIAVAEQESGIRTDPVVSGLPKIAWEEIDRRAEQVGVPRLLVRAALQLRSPTGASFSDRIDGVKTERDLSDIFEDFIGMVPMGSRLFAGANPVRTRGPMQVQVAFAERHADVRPYPYPVKGGIGDELFTRRGGVYFGVAHLLDYPASYDRHLFRFADFNAGQYASRNAAFQDALSIASGIPLVPDGALLSREGPQPAIGNTELAARVVGKRIDIGESAIRRALEQGRSATFERTSLYEGVFALADQIAGRRLPRATVPRIDLQGPKIRRPLTTEWFARRVDERFRRCLSR